MHVTEYISKCVFIYLNPPNFLKIGPQKTHQKIDLFGWNWHPNGGSRYIKYVAYILYPIPWGMSQELKFIFTPLSHLLKFCGYCSHDPNRGTRQVAFVAILNLGTLQRCKGRGLSRISSRIHAETMNHHCSSFRIVWTKYKSNKMTLVINTTAYVHESVFYWISWTKNNTLSLHAICWVSNVFLYSHGLFPWQKSTCPREGLPLPFENSFCFKRSWLQSRPNFSNSSLGEGNVIFDALDDWYSEAQPISGEELPFLYPRWNQIWLLYFFFF